MNLSVNVDKQRMVVAPILRLVYSLTSLVDTSELFEVNYLGIYKKNTFYYTSCMC